MRACAAAATSALHCMPTERAAAAARWDHVCCWPVAWTFRTSLQVPTIYIYIYIHMPYGSNKMLSSDTACAWLKLCLLVCQKSRPLSQNIFRISTVTVFVCSLKFLGFDQIYQKILVTFKSLNKLTIKTKSIIHLIIHYKY